MCLAVDLYTRQTFFPNGAGMEKKRQTQGADVGAFLYTTKHA